MADPIPNAGTQTDPTEFRRLLAQLLTPGVISGLVISAGTGLAVNVSAGNAVVGDATSATFLPYPATQAVAALPPSTVTTIYATYRTTGDLQAYLTTALPSTPYEVVGTVTTTSTGVASVDNSVSAAGAAGKRHRSQPTSMVGFYHSTQAEIAATLGILVSGGFEALPNVATSHPVGARLGATTQATARWYARAHRATSQDGIASNVWSPVFFTTEDLVRGDYPEYTNRPHQNTASARFYAGPSGTYQLSARVNFSDPSGTNVGSRQSRIVRYNSAGQAVWVVPCDKHNAAAETGMVWFEAALDMSPGDYAQFEVLHTQGVAISLLSNSYTGVPCWGSLTLIQVA